MTHGNLLSAMPVAALCSYQVTDLHVCLVGSVSIHEPQPAPNGSSNINFSEAASIAHSKTLPIFLFSSSIDAGNET